MDDEQLRELYEGCYGRLIGQLFAVCGDLATEPRAVALLVSLGVDQLSVPPPAIAITKERIRSLNIADE